MENKEIIKYEERFFLRKRVHYLMENGVKTKQEGFFESSEIFTQFRSISGCLQYKSSLQWSLIIGVITLLIGGTKGLFSSNSKDSFVFVISISMIGFAIYLVILFINNVDYVGSYYFSNYNIEEEKGFIIKSKYPASENLHDFLEAIKEKRKAHILENLLLGIDKFEMEEDLIGHLNYLKSEYDFNDEDYKMLLTNAKQKWNK